MDVAEPKIAGAFPDQPTTEASVRAVLGDTYYYLGEPVLAIRQARACPGTSDGRSSAPTTPTRSPARTTSPWPTRPPDSMTVRSRCSSGRWRPGGQARPRPPRHPHQPEQPRTPTGTPASWTGDPALRADLAIQTAKLGPDHPDTLTSRNNLAHAYRDAGR